MSKKTKLEAVPKYVKNLKTMEPLEVYRKRRAKKNKIQKESRRRNRK